MSKPKKDRIREERIRNEAVVDAYGTEEQAMGWYYYLENKLRFPFQAKCIASKVVSPLRKGETVEVRRMAPEDSCFNDMLVLIRWQGRNMAVPLSQLTATDADESTIEVIGMGGFRRSISGSARESDGPRDFGGFGVLDGQESSSRRWCGNVGTRVRCGFPSAEAEPRISG